MKPLRFRVLFLASWYPNRLDPILGVFVKKKAEAVSHLCDVAVVHPAKDPSLKSSRYETEIQEVNGILTVNVYFKPSSTPLIRGLVYNLRYFRSLFIGWHVIKSRWGTPDVLHVNVVERCGYFGVLIRLLKRIPFVITEHSTPEIDSLKHPSKPITIRHRFFQGLVYRFSSFASVDSRASLRYMEHAGFRTRFCVIPNVVDMKQPRQHQRSKKRTGKIVALHVSNLIGRKNVADIVRAFSHISKERNDFELHVVGEGENRTQLENLAREWGTLNDSIFFHGYVNEQRKYELFLNANFHVLNSTDEGFSVVTAEAIFLGIPVIATRCGGPEDFVNEDVGLLIERKSLDELENAVRRMLDTCRTYDSRMLQEYGKERFGPDVVARQTYEMYEKAAVLWKAGNTSRSLMIAPDWKVLDVGSGHQPNRRANILLERYLGETIHRTTQRVVVPTDRDLVVGDALKMPFRDKSFDYVVASHIAEHVDDPLQFCNELQRVAKRGYIETPGPLTEYLLPTSSHKWVVSQVGALLVFKKNLHQKPPSRLFFRFFYLNREGYNDPPLKTNNSILKVMNLILIKLWKFVPGAYSSLEWEGELAARFATKAASDPRLLIDEMK